MEEAAAGKARLPTVVSLTDGTMRPNATHRLVAGDVLKAPIHKRRRFRRPGTLIRENRTFDPLPRPNPLTDRHKKLEA